MSLKFEHEKLKNEIVRLLNQYEHVDSFHKEHNEMGEAVHSRNLRKIYNNINNILDEHHKQYPKDIEKYRKQTSVSQNDVFKVTQSPNSRSDIFVEQSYKFSTPVELNCVNNSVPTFGFTYDNSDQYNNTLIIGARETGKTTLVKKIISKLISETINVSSVIWVSNGKSREDNLPKEYTVVEHCAADKIPLFEKLKPYLIAALNMKADHIYVVFDDTICGVSMYEEVKNCMEVSFPMASNKIQCFITHSYMPTEFITHKHLFKYIVAFKENKRVMIERLYNVFYSVKDADLFNAFVDTMQNQLANYNCLVKIIKNESDMENIPVQVSLFSYFL